MTTKDQERKALEQIRKIVEGLGENSYVGTAFEGCFDDAEENIENDWALSMNGRWQDAEQKIEQYKVIRDELVEENKALKEKVENLETARETADDMYNKAAKSRDAYHDESIKNWNMFREQEDKVAALELEIIKLKARLFDLLDK